MASTKQKARNRKARITVPTPAEIKRRREAAENSRLEREAMERENGKREDRWGVDEAALINAVVGPMGPRPTDINVKRDASGKIRSAWRSNPFKLLLESGSISQDESNAAFDMMKIYAASKGKEGEPERSVPVDGGDPDAWGREDRKQYHIRLRGIVLNALTRKSAKLIQAFEVALVDEDRPVVWRGIVERSIGEGARDRQTARMQVMCEELCANIPKCRKTLNDQIDRKGMAA